MFVLKHKLQDEGGDGTGGSAGGPDLGSLQASLKEMESKMTEQSQEIDRLRNHSAKILDEKKQLQQQFKAFEGLGDPETISNMLKQFENNEDAKLVAEGKFTDVLEKHTERLKLDFQNQVKDLSEQLTKAQETGSKYETLFHESEAGHAIRAVAAKAGVRDTAIDDILLRGKGLFTVSSDGTLEARDNEGNLRVVDGKPLTPELFVAGLREKYPHYWPESQSGGARGGSGTANTPNPFMKGTKDYNVTEQARLRKSDPALAEKLAAEANK